MIIHTHTTSLYIKKQLQLLKVRYQFLIIKTIERKNLWKKRKIWIYLW